MADKYEYHKQNDYPGERVAEKKRVSDRAEEADKRADARVAEKGRTDRLNADNRVAEKGRTDRLNADSRVAEKGRVDGLNADSRVARRGKMDDELMDSEIERSTERAKGVNRSRNSADMIGLVVIGSIMLILVAGLAWGYVAMQDQANQINTQTNKINSQANQIITLNTQIAGSASPQIPAVPDCNSLLLSDINKQVEIYKDFLVTISDVKKEIMGLRDYKAVISNNYQLCASYIQRSNDINHALIRFDEKEMVYYKQISVLAEKPQCIVLIDRMNATMTSSKAADEQLYLQNMKQCGRLMNNQSGDSMIQVSDAATLQIETDWKNALDDATAKAQTFTDAENTMIACFA